MHLVSRLVRALPAIVAVALLAACSTTGQGFKAAGINNITVGKTTLEQASQYLAAKPVDVWQQGDTTLARWAVKSTVATDAVYIRQEAWLRFGADGTFQRVENTINIPALIQPKPAEPEQNHVWQAPGINGNSQLSIPAGDSTGIQVETSAGPKQPGFTYPVDINN